MQNEARECWLPTLHYLQSGKSIYTSTLYSALLEVDHAGSLLLYCHYSTLREIFMTLMYAIVICRFSPGSSFYLRLTFISTKVHVVRPTIHFEARGPPVICSIPATTQSANGPVKVIGHVWEVGVGMEQHCRGAQSTRLLLEKVSDAVLTETLNPIVMCRLQKSTGSPYPGGTAKVL